ncbi:MAG TPA: hypothetical protein VHT73_03160 [Thermodesulfobacteriota bacterium]|nr:hypothetical protein [Thermodesulfobacteriota bacterium]
MLIFCSWCETYVGERRPFWDRSIYHDVCEECHKKFENEFENEDDINEGEWDESHPINKGKTKNSP